VFISLAVILSLLILIMNLPVFGRLPTGERLERISEAENYSDGSFQNASLTPVKPEGVSYFTIIKTIAKKNKNSTPPFALPAIKPDFSAKPGGSQLIWFGHSSYFIRTAGLNILVDPVFSKTTSPFTFIGNSSYLGTDFIHPADLPDIDILLITHDHYDHFDYPTILKLKSKTKLFVTSIGVGAHLEHWGVKKEQIRELLWNEEFKFNDQVGFIAKPARHFSGRLFKRNKSLWSSFILKTADQTIYLGGDSGYDTHFKAIGDQYGPFDLAILECGQYNELWPYIHMFPEQTVQAALDLKAKVLLPVHWGKFTLAQHDWDEPIERLLKASASQGLQVTTPMLGESIKLQEYYPASAWWRLSSPEDKQSEK
jgi:L-ascorbate metabolism protein UlaG (beta-lactamase superfamily)